MVTQGNFATICGEIYSDCELFKRLWADIGIKFPCFRRKRFIIISSLNKIIEGIFCLEIIPLFLP